MTTSNLYIGTAGWSYKDWQGKFYPEKLSRGIDKLSYYSKYFNIVEINSSFYHIPPPRNAEGWVRKVEEAEDFKFSIKLWRGFTHESKYPAERERDYFSEVTSVLYDSGHLGAILVQFPWSFKNDDNNITRIKRISRDFRSFPLVIEIRHKSWDVDSYYKLLEEEEMNFCNIDQPVIGESLEPTAITTGNVGYIRLHGRNYGNWFARNDNPADRYNYLYKDSEIDSWVKRIKKILRKDSSTIVIANNHWQGKAAHTALKLKNGIADEKPKAPETLRETYTDLIDITTPDITKTQTDLF